MKRKVLHCVEDPSMGGVIFALQSLCGSSLQNDFDFVIRYVDLTKIVTLEEIPDIICFHGASNWRKLFYIAWLKLNYPKVKLVLQEHHYSAYFITQQIQSPKRFYWMLKLSYKLMDKVIAIAPSQQQWMLKNKLLPADKIALLGQGRDLSNFYSVAESKKSSNLQSPSQINSIPVIAAYGRFHYQKGFDLLIKAMKQVKLPCFLKLAGEGEQLIELNKLATDMPNVELVGKVHDVPRFLQQCDAVIIPSRWEPFGLIFIESLAMHKPIISSTVDGLGDQIKQHQAHYLTSNNIDSSAISTIDTSLTIEAIADAITAFLSQPTSSDSLTINETNAIDSNTDYIKHWKVQQWLDLQQAWKTLFNQL